jgi:ribosomal protein S18 acetylase RimI-like enzyme
MAPIASELIYLTMGKMADYLFGAGDEWKARDVLKHLFRNKSNRFSHQFTDVAISSGNIIGLMISYSYRTMKSLEFPMAYQLALKHGLFRFFQFLKRALPLSGIQEAGRDEYFISNIAVLPSFQRQGIGKLLLFQAEKTARKSGFRKLSLTVDVENGQARKLYEWTEFRILKTITIESLNQRIGYQGYYRMVKDVS